MTVSEATTAQMVARHMVARHAGTIEAANRGGPAVIAHEC
jgi:hypothetical protein